MKILPNGIAVIENDSHISKWCEETGRLCHDETVPKYIVPLINEGDWVVDGGANIGDHTISYAEKVGPTGRVIAFEVNPPALACLWHNAKGYSQIEIRAEALSNVDRELPLLQDHMNFGASRLSHSGTEMVQAVKLDSLNLPRLNFCKLDLEGHEVHALDGAIETIMRCRPIILLEMNAPLLAFSGQSYAEVAWRLLKMCYRATPLQGDSYTEPQYDLLCRPLPL